VNRVVNDAERRLTRTDVAATAELSVAANNGIQKQRCLLLLLLLLSHSVVEMMDVAVISFMIRRWWGWIFLLAMTQYVMSCQKVTAVARRQKE
jgi:hypothetical protein